MAISKDEVKYIAQLAKLHFEEDEAEKFAKDCLLYTSPSPRDA